MSMKKIQNRFAPSVVKLAEQIDFLIAPVKGDTEGVREHYQSAFSAAADRIRAILDAGHGLMTKEEMEREAFDCLKQMRAERVSLMQRERQRTREAIRQSVDEMLDELALVSA
jgi:hypothetical protein